MDQKELYTLLKYFESSNISKLKFKDGDTEISVSKLIAPTGVVSTVPTSAPETNEPILPETMGETITAPLVGTFYSSPTPEAPPFVAIGERIKRGATLCILEAMKTLNELPAPFDCEIVEVCAQNSEFVGFGQQLFVVKKI